MESYYNGYPRRHCSSPYSNSNPNHYLHLFHNSNRNPNPTVKPRVVSIPIRFVNSNSVATPPPPHPPAQVAATRLSSEMAAVKLQKVIRGFLVRKNLKIVRKIEVQAETIGEEIAREEMVLEKEVKERIRIGEMLMRLLFQLDSVRGVREYRKKVIRNVISLQELVDSIGTRGDKVDSDTIEVERLDVAVDSAESTAIDSMEENKVLEAVDSMEEAPIDVTDSIDTNNCTEKEENMVVESVDPYKESPIEPTKSTETLQMEKLGEKPNCDEELAKAHESEEVCDPTETIELGETIKRSNVVDPAIESSQVVACNNVSNEMEMEGTRDVMERVLVESAKMKNLMEELCQRSAQQWRLTEGLADQVQRLEREVEKMAKKEKRRRKGNGQKRRELQQKVWPM